MSDTDDLVNGVVRLTLVEGLMGCGKSFLCNELVRRSPSIDTCSRPVLFCVEEDINADLLTLFYNNPERYAFLIQLTTLERRTNAVNLRIQHQNICRLQLDDKPRRDRIGVLDRSLLGDFVFALANYVMGRIDDHEMQVYCHKAGATHVTQIAHAIDIAYGPETPWRILYLHSPAADCKNRVDTIRQTVEADIVSLSYYQLLEQIYFNVIRELRGSRPNAVTVVTWNQYSDADKIRHHVCHKSSAGQRCKDVPTCASRCDDPPPRTSRAEPSQDVNTSRMRKFGLEWFDHTHIDHTMRHWARHSLCSVKTNNA